MIAPFVDPRVRMRAALHTLVQADPERWHEPSLAVFRNRLLDLTGSDARPLAELLLEALQRGWRELLPRERIEPSRWDALAAPFVMRWSAERFIQPDMAQWAAESWGFALGLIAPEQLRIAPPAPPTTRQSRGDASMATAGRTGAATTTRGAKIGTFTRAPSASRVAPPVAAGGRTRMNAKGRYTATGGSALPMLDPRIVWGLAAAAVLSYAGFIARIGWAVRQNKKAEQTSVANVAARPLPALTPSQPSGGAAPLPAGETASAVIQAPVQAPAQAPVPAPVQTPVNTGARRAPLSMPQGYTTVTSTPMAAGDTSVSARTGGTSPGVPSLTRGLMDAPIGDRSRMLYREPAQRASGSSLPLRSAPATSPPSLAYDEVFLNDGSSMRGRVEIVRAGSVLFRDQRTGLRHELRKDDIDRIITEFGSPVRFRAERRTTTDAAPSTRVPLRLPAESGVRARGVSGAYVVRYGTATATGSPECTSLWSRPPATVDRAVVKHVPGADTLTVFFDGGDNFPSNIDAEGYFASTFRIVRDQARTSTALTTRLTGQFRPDGILALQVSIVFFRRMREGQDLTCSVNIQATGTPSAK